MPNNFNLGTRDLYKAGKFCLVEHAKSKDISFCSMRTYCERWKQFVDYAKSRKIKWLEDITNDIVLEYGEQLKKNVKYGKMSSITAQSYIGAINRVMHLATKGQWQSVKAVKHCRIYRYSRVRKTIPDGINLKDVYKAASTVEKYVNKQMALVLLLTRLFGLRVREASMLNPVECLLEAEATNCITIKYGTKGGRIRKIPLFHYQQIYTLRKAAQIQDKSKSLISNNKNWKEWREQDIRKTLNIIKVHNISRIHELRAAYACHRYYYLSHHQAPVITNVIFDIDEDLKIRKKLSKELGHNRVEVVGSYIGGR